MWVAMLWPIQPVTDVWLTYAEAWQGYKVVYDSQAQASGDWITFRAP